MYTRIRDLREDKDMNQTQMAKILNMSQTGYSKYETGENDIPTTILIKLADFYHTSVDYLLGLDSAEQTEKAPTPDDARAEAKMLLEGMDDEQYQAALQYLKFLQSNR